MSEARGLVRDLALALCFAGLSVALGMVRFEVPGVPDAVVDLREVGLLIGVFHLRHWALTLIPAALTSVRASSSDLMVSAVLVHMIGASLAWFAHRGLVERTRARSGLTVAGLWAGFVVVWYLGVMLPLIALSSWIAGMVPAEGIGGTYLVFLRAVPYEIISTASTTSLYLANRHELERRRRTELALRDSERRMASILATVPVGVARVVGERLVFVNDRLAELAGRPAASLVGTPVAELLGPLTAFDGRGAELVLRRAGGPELNVVVHARSHGDGLTLSVLDITDRVVLEQRLRQAQKLDALGQLAGGVAHDFNNMLAVITLNHSAIRAFLAKGRDVSEQLDAVDEALGHAGGVVNQLLSFARRQPSLPRAVDLGELLRRVTPLMSSLIGRSIQTRLDIEPGLPPIHADPTMVEQVLMNLMINARDAMGEGERRIVISARSSEEGIVLSVSDTGCGMDEATCARIFEPFFTTKPEGKGTGLGLATVYGIVRQHGASIDVASQPGAGTTFRITWRPSVAA